MIFWVPHGMYITIPTSKTSTESVTLNGRVSVLANNCSNKMEVDKNFSEFTETVIGKLLFSLVVRFYCARLER